MALTLRVPVLEIELEPDTELVELRDTMEVREAILVVDIEEDTDGDDVVELVGQALIVSDIVCELDEVYDNVSTAEIDGTTDVEGAELTEA